jgi:hypothetical protein
MIGGATSLTAIRSFIAKCQIECVVSVSGPGFTGGNRLATAVQHGSPCRRYGRAPLRLTA